MSDTARPRIAWFTPLRPVQSGISLYSEELLPIISQLAQVDVYVDGYRPQGVTASESLRLLNARSFRWHDSRRRYDAVVYQMGNSPAHAYMYQLALERPGLLVLHDTMLHHLMLAVLVGRGKIKAYRSLMSRRYGERGAEVAERVRKGQTPASLFEFPLSEDLIEAAETIVVHSNYSRDQVLALKPDARVDRVPMGIRLPPPITRDEARAALGLPPEQFIIASITLANPYKRLDVVMRAVRRLCSVQGTRLIIAGEVSPAFPLERMLRHYGLDDRAELRGYVSDREATLIAAAADVLVNLRYPTAGETSASLLRLMAAGRPVLVSDAGSFAELPDDVVAKVPVDALETETVHAFLTAFAQQPELAVRLGRNARQFIEREHSLFAMARAYRRVLQRVVDGHLPEPAVDPVESFSLDPIARSTGTYPWLEETVDAMAELGLANDTGLQRELASAAVGLGIGAGKIQPEGIPRTTREGSTMSADETNPISDELLEILACPVCKTPVRLEGQKLVCDSCGRRYRIDDGIPIMLVDEAELPNPK